MYLRFSQRANADGTVVRYVALAHNRRVDGKVKPDVLMNLGRVDRLDVDGLLRLAASIKAQRERDPTRTLSAKARGKAEAAHLRAECALRDHPTLGRPAAPAAERAAGHRPRQGQGRAAAGRQVPAGHLRPDLSAEDVALGSKNLLEAERGLRDLQSHLLLRPVFHRLEHRIRAHALLCWLALLLTRVAERSCEQTWRQISREPGRLQPGHPGRRGRHDRPDHPAQAYPAGHLPGTFHRPATTDLRLRPRLTTRIHGRSGVGTRPAPALHPFPQLNPRIHADV
jgi:hypothetical protein